MTDSNKSDLDYKRLGLMAGLEIHQQLDTAHKLFCNCPTMLRDTRESTYEFFRYLRPTQSEMGETDQAALDEARFIRKFIYKAYPSTCLVENDEEPPRELNEEAIDITLMTAKLLNMQPVDEIHVMRKLVIDGSNTTGFQRTSLVATDGHFETSHGRVGVDVLCLEEEACQRVEERAGAVVFSLDRLGIPLVEIGTAPDIATPAHAREAAEHIGMVLRSTGVVKRGIGTIRQDINISIADGARVEVKGVQELDLIETIVKQEALRQVRLLEIRDELQRRGASVGEIVDVTDIFEDTESAVIKKKMGSVLALRLCGFAGMVGAEIQPDRRLGSEFSDRAKKAGVGGVFHTDELPGYGITDLEVERLRAGVDARGGDCVVIVADEHDRAASALQAVVLRAEQALAGVPEETRKMLPAGTTAYLRPLPGAARMYPETDVPPVQVTGRINKITTPELLSERKDRYVREYSLSDDLARQIVYSSRLALFEDVMDTVSVDGSLVVRTLTATLTELKKEGVLIEKLQNNHFSEIFGLVADGKVAKEGIIDILRLLAEQPHLLAEDAAASLCLIGIDEEQTENVIARVVTERRDFVHERGMAALGPLMGVVMQELRGKADGKLISKMLTEKIGEELS
ncbi:MAG TPA: Glu-tRNA(Gln) amidotransferase subunit GatE [Methanosarcinales archaeon]|nr:Glu-tRNA(Gln) amidotransferase subunit GatE [Methanosarcinales archaeon]